MKTTVLAILILVFVTIAGAFLVVNLMDAVNERTSHVTEILDKAGNKDK